MIGYGIYRGGVHLNLSRSSASRASSSCSIAAGLLATAVHSAHEAGWWNSGLAQAFDLTLARRPGLGAVRAHDRDARHPAAADAGETVVCLLYAVPMLIYVLSPAGLASGRLRSRSSVSTAETAS